MKLSFKQAKLIALLLALVVVTGVVADEPPENKSDVKRSKRAQSCSDCLQGDDLHH